MKKLLFFISIFSAILLLSGCVSIPLTDGGTLEISDKGLTIIPSEVEDESKDEVTTDGKSQPEEEPMEDEEKEEEYEPDEDEDTNVENGETEFEGSEMGFGGCANEFYLVVNRLPEGLPIKPCTYVRHMEIVEDEENNKRMVVAHYDDYESLEEVHGAYKAFFKGKGYTISTDSIKGNFGELTAKGKGMELSLRIGKGN